MKPHFAVLVPLLLFRKQGKVLLSLFATILFGLLSPALFLGWKTNQEFHIAWFQTMLERNQTIGSSKNTL